MNKKSRGQTALLGAVRSGSAQCLAALLKAGADVNLRDDYGCTALFAVDLGHSSPWKEIPWRNQRYMMDLVNLLLAAGETANETELEVFPEYLKPSAEISLMHICREIIRKHLLAVSNVNLFVRVPQLPLPRAMTSYLLHDVSLEEMM